VLSPLWAAGEPGSITDICGLAEARGIVWRDGRLRIGALETIERCRTDADVVAHAPSLARACGVVGSLGVRLLGTLGGNIGWRQGDTLPALLALGAEVETVAGTMPLEDLLGLAVMPLVLTVLVPPAHGVTVYEKVGHRAAFSLSAATVAGCVDREAGIVRLAASAAGHPARRLPRAEAMLITPALPARTELAAVIADEIASGPGHLAGRVLAGLLLEALTT